VAPQGESSCHRIPNFVEKAARAGCKRVFIGLENINPDNLLQAKKKQNRVHEYRQMFLAWRAQRIITYAPTSTPRSRRLKAPPCRSAGKENGPLVLRHSGEMWRGAGYCP